MFYSRECGGMEMAAGGGGGRVGTSSSHFPVIEWSSYPLQDNKDYSGNSINVAIIRSLVRWGFCDSKLSDVFLWATAIFLPVKSRFLY